MKVKTSQETVEKLIDLLERFDASTEQFLDNLPTPEKYAILAMALTVRLHFEDFETANDELIQKVSAHDLTKNLIDFQHLDSALKDALEFMRKQPDYFEMVGTNGKDEDYGDDEDDEDDKENKA
ncbi:MAG: hypothetical protein JWR19_3734 [Pedosphaera sp.]|nr:hypothetical protein [Pedosphaera sp.]